MIVVKYSKGRYCPMVLCDVCKEPITDAGMAAVVQEPTNEPEAILKIQHVHKRACHNTAEAAMHATGWEELETHLAQLCWNVGFTPKAMQARLDVPDL